jgi:hypothetical protein
LSSASLELLASRADVWSFLAEPYHLSDWWPGIHGVVPDRRGFAPGARWHVRIHTRNVLTGRRERESVLVVGEVHPFERWTFHVVATRLDVDVRLHAVGNDRTLVRIHTSSRRRALPRAALRRLYDLCQTAAGL